MGGKKEKMTGGSSSSTCTRDALSSSSSSSSTTFERFLQGWHHRQERLLAEMTAAVEGKNCGSGGEEEVEKELVARALGHFEEFYDYKSRAAHQNVFGFFGPTWSSTLECAFLWVTGFRPALLFQLVSDSVSDLTPDQTRALNRLKRETKTEEKALLDELAKVQESIAAPPHLEMMREAGRQLPEDEHYISTLDESMGWLRMALEEVVTNADSLRVSTAARVVEVLTLHQCLRFLISALRLQQSTRSVGMQRDNLHDRNTA